MTLWRMREASVNYAPRSCRLPPMDAAEVKRLRTRLKASQAVFAHYLNVSAKLVQAWESDRRTPDGPALVLGRGTGSCHRSVRPDFQRH